MRDPRYLTVAEIARLVSGALLSSFEVARDKTVTSYLSSLRDQANAMLPCRRKRLCCGGKLNSEVSVRSSRSTGLWDTLEIFGKTDFLTSGDEREQYFYFLSSITNTRRFSLSWYISVVVSGNKEENYRRVERKLSIRILGHKMFSAACKM